MKKRLIVLALAFGLAVFGAFTVSITPKATTDGAFAAFALPGYNVVIKITEKNAAACDDPFGCDDN